MGLNGEVPPSIHLSAVALPRGTDATATQDAVPVEILIDIVRLLAPPELAVCIRASRQLYLIGIEELYRSVTVDLERKINPLFVTPPAAPKQRFAKIINVLSRYTPGSKEAAREKAGSRQWLSSRIRSLTSARSRDRSSLGTLPHRFTFIVHLTVLSHSGILCKRLTPVDLPNLESLRIFPPWRLDFKDICYWHHPFSSPSGHCASCEYCSSCSLTTHLRPRRLILGGAWTKTGSSLTWNYADPLPSSVKEAVVHVGACVGMEFWQTGWMRWLEMASTTVKDITLIFQPREHDWFEEDGVWRMKEVMAALWTFHASTLWGWIGRALSGETGAYTVVGLETLDRNWSDKSLEGMIEAVRHEVKEELERKGWKVPDAKERAGMVRFMKRTEYDEQEKLKYGR